MEQRVAAFGHHRHRRPLQLLPQDACSPLGAGVHQIAASQVLLPVQGKDFGFVDRVSDLLARQQIEHLGGAAAVTEQFTDARKLPGIA